VGYERTSTSKLYVVYRANVNFAVCCLPTIIHWVFHNPSGGTRIERFLSAREGSDKLFYINDLDETVARQPE
jgi:hypothetical protein